MQREVQEHVEITVINNIRSVQLFCRSTHYHPRPRPRLRQRPEHRRPEPQLHPHQEVINAGKPQEHREDIFEAIEAAAKRGKIIFEEVTSVQTGG